MFGHKECKDDIYDLWMHCSSGIADLRSLVPKFHRQAVTAVRLTSKRGACTWLNLRRCSVNITWTSAIVWRNRSFRRVGCFCFLFFPDSCFSWERMLKFSLITFDVLQIVPSQELWRSFSVQKFQVLIRHDVTPLSRDGATAIIHNGDNRNFNNNFL